MKYNKDNRWKPEAVVLKEKLGMNSREIGEALGIPDRTVRHYFQKRRERAENEGERKPNILLFDIETSLIRGYFWGLFNQNMTIDQIEEDWYVICWAGQWLGEEEIFGDSVHHHDIKDRSRFNERLVVESLWEKLDQADVVVAYNGKKFDKKKMNWKFLQYGLPEPSPYKIVDPYSIVSGNFSPTSKKMDFIARYVEDIEEIKNSTNIKLWIDCMNDDIEKLDYMYKYCEQDVTVLEQVYLTVRHWDKNAPNLALYYNDDEVRCNKCGSDDLTYLEDASANTNVSSFSAFRCNSCGGILRDRVNTLTKEKRQSLLMNVR